MRVFNIITFSLLLISCNRPLNKTHSYGKVDVRVYTISEITNSYIYIDISKEGSFETVFRSNDSSIDSIYMKSDSLFIRVYPGTPLYIHTPVKFDLNIIIDSTANPYQRFRDKNYF